jgi:succinate-semialdehyde dehydrogenase/glutarate-semialdehyde dehydrogenase
MPSQLIDGAWEDGDSSLEVTNPADGSIVGRVAWGGPQDARRAADAAERAFGAWSDLPARRRADILLDASRLIAERADELGALLAREAGKRLP